MKVEEKPGFRPNVFFKISQVRNRLSNDGVQ